MTGLSNPKSRLCDVMLLSLIRCIRLGTLRAGWKYRPKDISSRTENYWIQ